MLLDHYLLVLKNYIDVDESQFIEQHKGFALIRLMQAMGAYGFRGFYERKTEFLQSIPYALKQMEYIVRKFKLQVPLPHLWDVLARLAESKDCMPIFRRLIPAWR